MYFDEAGTSTKSGLFEGVWLWDEEELKALVVINFFEFISPLVVVFFFKDISCDLHDGDLYIFALFIYLCYLEYSNGA